MWQSILPTVLLAGLATVFAVGPGTYRYEIRLSAGGTETGTIVLSEEPLQLSEAFSRYPSWGMLQQDGGPTGCTVRVFASGFRDADIFRWAPGDTVVVPLSSPSHGATVAHLVSEGTALRGPAISSSRDLVEIVAAIRAGREPSTIDTIGLLTAERLGPPDPGPCNEFADTTL